VQTWHKLYPQYADNIGAVMQGGSLMQKIKHELINPMPGKPPKYDNIVIMVGEDRKDMPIAGALMKAVNKFPGYEHVKVSLETIPRTRPISFTKLRDVLKNPNATLKQQYAVWAQGFNAQQLGKDWILHLMDISRKGMGITAQPAAPQPVPVAEQRLFNALIRTQKTPMFENAPTSQMVRDLINPQGREAQKYAKFDSDREQRRAKMEKGALADRNSRKYSSEKDDWGNLKKEEFNSEYDDEAGMAQSNLRTMARAVDGLLKTIKNNDNLPEWGQEKIAKAEMMLVSVWDYLQSQKELGMDPKVNESRALAGLKQIVAELSSEKLGQYKKAAGAQASAADKVGDTKKADKRFSGIVKATKKQFANDEKGVAEGAPIVVAQAPIDIRNPKKAPQPYRNQGDIIPPTKPPSTEKRGVKGRPGQRPMPDYSVAEDADRAEAQADYMEGQCMVLAIAINQHNPTRYPIGYIWEYNTSAGAPDMQMDDDEWNNLSPQEQQEISNDISRHSVVHAYVRDQETGEYIDARGRHKTLPNLWGRLGQTRFEEFPGSARELIDITAHGDWDEVGDQVNFKRGQPAFDSLAGPAGIKRAQEYAVKYLGVEGSKNKLRIGNIVRAVVDGKRVQGEVIGISSDYEQVELWLSGVNDFNPITVDVRDIKPVSEQGVAGSMEEGVGSKLAGLGLAGAMALGSAGANARVTPGDDPNINRLTGKPNVTQVAPSDVKPAASAGFNKEWLQKAADPNRTGRYMISVEKAQELLNKMNAVDEAKKKGADGKACWKNYRYAGTENGKDKCVPVGEDVENIMGALIENLIRK
jgi:hypothetical protein